MNNNNSQQQQQQQQQQNTTTMTRKEILDTVSQAVLTDRQQSYGPPEQSFLNIALFWGVYLEIRSKQPDGTHRVNPLQPHDVAAMMTLMKLARIASNPTHADSWVDAAGYAVCGGELVSTPQPQTVESERDLQACNTAQPEPPKPRPLNSFLSEEEAIELSRAAHKLSGQTLIKWTEFDLGRLKAAILYPLGFEYGQYLAIMSWLSSSQAQPITK